MDFIAVTLYENKYFILRNDNIVGGSDITELINKTCRGDKKNKITAFELIADTINNNPKNIKHINDDIIYNIINICKLLNFTFYESIVRDIEPLFFKLKINKTNNYYGKEFKRYIEMLTSEQMDKIHETKDVTEIYLKMFQFFEMSNNVTENTRQILVAVSENFDMETIFKNNYLSQFINLKFNSPKKYSDHVELLKLFAIHSLIRRYPLLYNSLSIIQITQKCDFLKYL